MWVVRFGMEVDECQEGGCGEGGGATMERVPNRRWTGSTVGSKELVEVEQVKVKIATKAKVE